MRYEFKVAYLDGGQLVIAVRNVDSYTTVGFIRDPYFANSGNSIVTGQISRSWKHDIEEYHSMKKLAKSLNNKFRELGDIDSDVRDREILNIIKATK